MLKLPSFSSPYRLYRARLRIPQQHLGQKHQTRCFQTHPSLQALQAGGAVRGKGPLRTRFDDIKPTDLAAYWDTQPPLESQLEAAERFFAPSRHSPVKLFSAAQFRTMPFDSREPEVAFLGRSNVGKSSLINALLGEEICWASATPGRTREMNAFGIGGTKGGESKIVLLDMPGYGKGSREDQGMQIMKYLQNRKQLRRTYLLIDPLHGIKGTDLEILSFLRRHAISHQIVLSKVDRVLADKLKNVKNLHVDRAIKDVRLVALRKMFEKMRPIIQPGPGQGEGPGALGEIISCCATTKKMGFGDKSFLGINALRWSVLRATGFDGSIQTDVTSMVNQMSPSKPEKEIKTPGQSRHVAGNAQK